MADRDMIETSGGKGKMNGNLLGNGLSKGKSPLSQANGNANTSTTALKSGEKKFALTNGLPTTQSMAKPAFNMDDLPEEVLALVNNIPPEAYVPMARLIERVVQTCWTDFTRLMEDLSTVNIADPKDVKDRIPGEVQTPNDTSETNRAKKFRLWTFAENHKRALVKLLVLIQWSANTDEVKVTIALNNYLHRLRAAFSSANNKVDEWIYFLSRQQDAAPDLDTAVELLAAGRVANLPTLGYVNERTPTAKEMLATLRRLNHILNVRMLSENHLPPPFKKWRVHDGRVTFSIPDEFDISLSVLSEDEDAKFQVVDVNFSFSPRPAMSQALLDEILTILNNQLLTKGLDGAYQFLHDLTMSQKLKELHRQAVGLLQGLWANNLRVELHRRTLVVQYWTRRASPKSWVEVTINSGRTNSSGGISEYPIPYLHLRWLRHGKLCIEHDIHINLSRLSFENILNEVTAYHINYIFDNIYDKINATKLFSSGELRINQDMSATDGSACSLAIQLTKMQRVNITCDPVSGELVISPAGERANRLQAELRSSKSLVDDFIGRLTAFRCGVAQAALVKAIGSSTWRSLPGRKPTLAEVRELFGPSTYRAVFFRQKDWSGDWVLAASFGSEGDFWWLVCEPKDSKRIVQRFRDEPTHIRKALSFSYFEALAKDAATKISLQMLQNSAEGRGLKSNMPDGAAGIKLQLPTGEGLNSLANACTIAMLTNKKGEFPQSAAVCLKSTASHDTLQLLASAGLDSSTTVITARRLVQFKIGCLIGENKMDHIMKRIHYIDDVTSCLRLIHEAPGLSLRSLTSDEIVINYATNGNESSPLSFALRFHKSDSQALLRLLPEDTNPHLLVSDEMQSYMSQHDIPLFERLKEMLEFLQGNLAIVRSLQYLQGTVQSQEVPEMSTLDLNESRKWLRIRVIPRSMIQFAVHYFSTKSAFKHRDDVTEIPEKLLVRLEVEPHFSSSGSKTSWTIRPAIEEFRNYTRASFSSQELKQHLQEKVFSADDQSWLGLDHAVRVQQTNPYPAIIALHDAILEWLRTAIETFSREPKPQQTVQLPQTPVAANANSGRPQQPPPPAQLSVKQTHQQQHPPPPQQQQQQQQINRPQLTQEQQQRLLQARAMAGRGQGQPRPQSMMMPQSQGPNGGPRTMTAQPQQMRSLPPGAGRGRGQPGINMQGMQGMQGTRPQGQQNRQGQGQGQPRDVINLD